MTRLTIDQKTTTLQDLQKFADSVGDQAKIRGRTVDGKIELYVSKKLDTGFKEHFFGHKTNRQNNARLAVKTVLDNVKSDAKVGRGVDTALAHIFGQLPSTGELRGSALKQLISDASTARASEMKIGDQIHEALDQGDAATLDKLAKSLGDKLAAKLQGKSENEKLRAIGLPNHQVKDQLLKALAKQTTGGKGLLGGDYTPAPLARGEQDSMLPETRAFIDKVYLNAVTQLGSSVKSSRTVLVDAKSKEIFELRKNGSNWDVDYKGQTISFPSDSKGRPAPFYFDPVTLQKSYGASAIQLNPITAHEITLKGEDFVFEKHLAKGGFGQADVYKSTTTGKQIVLKTPIIREEDSPEAKFLEASNELKAHQQALGQGHPNIVGLEGAIRTPDGQLFLALEYAEHGDMFHFARDMQTSANLTTDQKDLVRLTHLKDLLNGLRHFQGEDQVGQTQVGTQTQTPEGMISLDVKSPNVLIDAQGVAKLADFGTAVRGNTRELKGSPVDNPIWVAPEILIGIDKFGEKVEAKRETQRQLAEQMIKTQFPKHEQKQLLKDVTSEIDHRKDFALQTEGFQATKKADTWGLGIIAYEMFFGETPFKQTGSFASQVSDDIKAFGSDFNNRVIKPSDRPNGQLTPIDHLINSMLHPDPTQRPDLDQVLSNPLFNNPQLGSQAVRNLVSLV